MQPVSSERKVSNTEKSIGTIGCKLALYVQTSLKMKTIHFYFEQKKDEEKEESGEGDLQGSTRPSVKEFQSHS